MEPTVASTTTSGTGTGTGTTSGSGEDLGNTNSTIPRDLDTATIQTLLDWDPNITESEFSGDIPGTSRRAKVRVRSLEDKGVAEIELELETDEDTSHTLRLTISTDTGDIPTLLGNIQREIGRSDFSTDPEDYSVTTDGIFSSPKIAAVVNSIAEQSTIHGISGEGIVWNAPQIPPEGDPTAFAALRELKGVEIGLGDADLPAKNFKFSGVTFDNLTVGGNLNGVEFDDTCNFENVTHVGTPDPATVSGLPDSQPAPSSPEPTPGAGEVNITPSEARSYLASPEVIEARRPAGESGAFRTMYVNYSEIDNPDAWSGGVAEIVFVGQNETGPVRLRLTVTAEPGQIETLATEWKNRFEDTTAVEPLAVGVEGSIFKDDFIAGSVEKILEESQLIALTGKNIQWAPPVLEGTDRFPNLRALPVIEIGRATYPAQDIVFTDTAIDQSACDICPGNSGVELSAASTGGAAPAGTPDPAATTAGPIAIPDHRVDVASLATAAGITRETITAARDNAAEYEPRTIQSVAPDAQQAGTLVETSIALKPDASGVIRLSFKGNNLPVATPSTDQNSVLELAFSTKGMTADDLTALESALTDAVTTAAAATLEAGVSITEHQAVKNVLASLEADLEEPKITNLFVENTFIEANDTNRSQFAGATLGGTTALEGALDREVLRSRPAIRNSVIVGLELAGISGRVEQSILRKLDVRSGHIDVVTDTASQIDRISAIGATVCGEINCTISGDFRRAVLGTPKQNLTGAAFELTGNALVYKVPRLLKDFVVDTTDRMSADTPPQPVTVLAINGVEISLAQFKANNKLARKEISELQSNSAYFIPTGDAVYSADNFLNRFTPEQLSSGERGKILLADGKVIAQCTFTESAPDPESGATERLKVDMTISFTEALPDGASRPDIKIVGAEAERALYALRRLATLDEDLEKLKFHHQAADRRVNQVGGTDPTADPAAAAAATATAPALQEEVTTVLNPSEPPAV